MVGEGALVLQRSRWPTARRPHHMMILVDAGVWTSVCPTRPDEHTPPLAVRQFLSRHGEHHARDRRAATPMPIRLFDLERGGRGLMVVS